MQVSACRRSGVLAVMTLLVFVFANAARAQVDTASVVGSVKDPTGAVISGAKVTITNVATGENQVTTVGSSGNYVFPYLRVGTYDVAAEATGFKRAVVTGIVLNVEDRKQVDISMELGTTTQEIHVNLSEPLLDTQTADVGHVTDSQQVQDLPLN